MSVCVLVQAAANSAGAGAAAAGRRRSSTPLQASDFLPADRLDCRSVPQCDLGTGGSLVDCGCRSSFWRRLAAGSALAWRTWKQSGAWLRQDILSRDGVAGRAEILRDFGARAVRKRGQFTRPGLSKPSIHDVSWTLGRSRGVTIHVSTEESMVIQGAPRSGKGLYVVINAILDAPGAVVTTSTRADNLVVTMRARMSDGRPVTVFDPQGMSGLPTTLRWSPVRGCDDPDIATRRALVITADTEMKGENAAWQKRSLIVLQCLLHAAALSGEGIAHSADGRPARCWPGRRWIFWAVPGGVGVAGRSDGDLGRRPTEHVQLLDWGLSRRGSTLVSEGVGGAGPTGRSSRSLIPRPSSGNGGTLYLIGTRSGAAAAGPYLSALIDDIDNAARELAFVAPGGRLDPPLSLILDEIANLSPWPGLPVVLSDGGGIGISTLVVLQSLSQARSGWSIEEAATIWDSAIIKVIFGGGSDERDLRSLAGLLGERSLILNTRSWSSQGRQDGEQIRESPVIRWMRSGGCLLVRRSCLADEPGRSSWTCVTGIGARTPLSWVDRSWRPSESWPMATCSAGSELEGRSMSTQADDRTSRSRRSDGRR